MNTQNESINIGQALGFVFEDENWLGKMLAGGIFAFASIFLIGIPINLGYMVETIRNIVQGESPTLPEWDNLGSKFLRGLVPFVIAIVYSIPLLVVLCMVLALAGLAGKDGQAAGAVVCCGQFFLIVLALLAAFMFPAALIQYAAKDELAAAFRFPEIFTMIFRHPGNYILAIVLGYLSSIFLSLLFISSPLMIGVGFVTGFWGMLVNAHLYAQVYRLWQRPV